MKADCLPVGSSTTVEIGFYCQNSIVVCFYGAQDVFILLQARPICGPNSEQWQLNANLYQRYELQNTYFPAGPKSAMMCMVCIGVLTMWLLFINSLDGSHTTKRAFGTLVSL